MYGPAVLGTTLQKLPFTGFTTAGYALLGIGLLVTGLLLARLGQERVDTSRSAQRLGRVGRAAAAVGFAVSGVLLLVFAGWWRGVETWGAAHTIHIATSDQTTGVLHAGVVVLANGTGPASVFALTNQCTVAQILGSLLIGGAPLLLVRRLSVLRVTTALLLASAVLIIVNQLRLTAIGVAVSAWGHDGFAVSHTYLGSLLTFVGTCLAGATFALVLLAHRRGRGEWAGDSTPGAACS